MDGLNTRRQQSNGDSAGAGHGEYPLADEIFDAGDFMQTLDPLYLSFDLKIQPETSFQPPVI